MKHQEEQILIDIKSGKDINLVLREIITTYKERLYWHIRNMLKNHDDTDDVLQNVFIKVYQNISKFKSESKLYSWLYRIATNEAITFLNKQANKKGITNQELSSLLVQNLKADVYYDGDEMQYKLQCAIATLPEKQQLVFNMKYFEDLKYKEISDILGTSEGALKASYHLATKKIEEFIKSN
ncbi:RNA polymerase sigma-70 factor (ECF subfamily) [Aquimarina brevivitae]|uniref:RNA polymerase sigma factor n=1 Tax=Aquimarina brevivitae TaxID=323412 RepID=A0A4Q7P188_9FLAO|nr:RNA polymerase sigma-70 factor (ECF subfamily) [Aquimarina brevivitae]